MPDPSRDVVAEAASLLESLARAIGVVEHDRLRALLAPDVRWVQVGRRPVVGVEAVLAVLDRYGPATALELGRVVADERAGAVTGVAVPPPWASSRSGPSPSMA